MNEDHRPEHRGLCQATVAGIGDNSEAKGHEAEVGTIIERITRCARACIAARREENKAMEEAGFELINLRETVPQAEWRAHIKTLPFSDRTRRRYMALARASTSPELKMSEAESYLGSVVPGDPLEEDWSDPKGRTA